MGSSSAEVADVLVVGAGMCGSAAARHLKEQRPALAVWLVGPEEEQARQAEAFSQHADEGRITRKLDPDPVWATLATRSIAQYAAIEEASGVQFHRQTGFLAIGQASGPYIQRTAAVAESQQMPLRGPLDPASLTSEFAFLAVDDENVGLLEDGAQGGAGLISPRALVRAQCLLFERAGGRIVREAVERVDCEGAPEDGRPMRVELRSGAALLARRVLVVAGALTCWRALLPLAHGHARLATDVVTQEVVRIAVSDEDRSVLANMPCIVCKFGTADFGKATTFDSCYILPPVEYPVGQEPASPGEGDPDRPQHYLKIGHGTWFERKLPDLEAAQAWMRGESEAGSRDGVTAREALQGMLDKVLPGIIARASHVVVDRCMWDTTPTMRPYIDMLPGGRVGCCAGGNGFAAKSSDELGRIAALMMLAAIDGTEWAYDIPRDTFKAVFEDDLGMPASSA